MNLATFWDAIRIPIFHGHITDFQVQGTEVILSCWAKWKPEADPRHVACCLGNIYHETNATMQPIREIGKGRGRAYGHPVGPWHQIYYGRGDVQETWEKNYIFADTKLHKLGIIDASVDLHKDPDKALDPTISAAIAIFGMDEGWFTGKKLADFFSGTRSDWLDSRTIINGHDKAALVASYGMGFYHGLTAVTAIAAPAPVNVHIAAPAAA